MALNNVSAVELSKIIEFDILNRKNAEEAGHTIVTSVENDITTVELELNAVLVAKASGLSKADALQRLRDSIVPPSFNYLITSVERDLITSPETLEGIAIDNLTTNVTETYINGEWRSGGLGYVLATWGANLQTLGRHPAINSPSNSAEITSLGIMASIPVPATGTLDTITYYNNTGDNTTEFQIIKNGVVVYTFTCTGPYGVETGINVLIGFVGTVPDNVAIRYSSGTAPSEGLYTAYIK